MKIYVIAMLALSILLAGCGPSAEEQAQQKFQYESASLSRLIAVTDEADIYSGEFDVEHGVIYDANWETKTGISRARDSLKRADDISDKHNVALQNIKNFSDLNGTTSNFTTAVAKIKDCYAKVEDIHGAERVALTQVKKYLDRQELSNEWNSIYGDLEVFILGEYQLAYQSEDADEIQSATNKVVADLDKLIDLSRRSNDIIPYVAEGKMISWATQYRKFILDAQKYSEDPYSADSVKFSENAYDEGLRIGTLLNEASEEYSEENDKLYDSMVYDAQLISSRMVGDKERVCQDADRFIKESYGLAFI